jgi:hypothetical protein
MTTDPPQSAAPTDLDDAWREQAIRLHRRYVLEIVEACGICPWAEPARSKRRTRETVLLERDDAALDASLFVLDQWGADEDVELGFLLYPRLPLARMAFEQFTNRLRSQDAQRHPLGSIPFVLAAFHPDAEPDTSDPERLIPFLRRTPDPCIQVLRASVLERVRGGSPQGTQFVDMSTFDRSAPVSPPLRERIATTNLETAHRMGVEALGTLLDAIKRDRDETYRELEAEEQRR